MKFLDDEKQIAYLFRIGGGGFADVDCYFDSRINKYGYFIIKWV